MPPFDIIHESWCEVRGIFRVEHEKPCWNCGRPTLYCDIDFGAPLCSVECQDTKLKEYYDACARVPVP